MSWFESMDCENLWHSVSSISHEVCPECGGSWKTEDRKNQQAGKSALLSFVLSALFGSLLVRQSPKTGARMYPPQVVGNGGVDETRTRDLLRDRQAF